ncbi:Zn-ribbon domain-containing OB-fold protein [Sphingobium algorifonticola]|uniref:ChsH2 C-terminal OB-fold domain-containing protein n=1 Tax=Sphingobium algorifonticola TaxID=2008318 RepID=A0A437JCR8_9SPHN|nr:OB-fold domain-containing protein [Sphingobium algorifonticola]RVT43553.1 hypothetical protein ENE74_02735 [Sphingobium algorifonticola]
MHHGPEQQWRDGLAQGRFLLQRDPETGLCRFPPRVTRDGTIDWVEAAGTGTVYSVTVVRQRPPEADYNVVLVDLDEGPRVMSRVDGVAPDAVTIGMRVRMTIGAIDGSPAALFLPESHAG